MNWMALSHDDADTETTVFIEEWFGSYLVHQCEQNHWLSVEVALNDMSLYQTSEQCVWMWLIKLLGFK